MPRASKIKTIVPITMSMVVKTMAADKAKKAFALLSGSFKYSFIGSLLILSPDD